jgi:hypothetical protein
MAIEIKIKFVWLGYPGGENGKVANSSLLGSFDYWHGDRQE